MRLIDRTTGEQIEQGATVRVQGLRWKAALVSVTADGEPIIRYTDGPFKGREGMVTAFMIGAEAVA